MICLIQSILPFCCDIFLSGTLMDVPIGNYGVLTFVFLKVVSNL